MDVVTDMEANAVRGYDGAVVQCPLSSCMFQLGQPVVSGIAGVTLCYVGTITQEMI